jgi:hypothetical protein
MSKNLEILSTAHKSFNLRNFDATVAVMSDEIAYRDIARGVTFHGKAEFKQFMTAWTRAFSTIQITDATVSSPSSWGAVSTMVTSGRSVPPGVPSSSTSVRS